MGELNDLLYEVLEMQNRGSLEKAADLAEIAYSTANKYCADSRTTPPLHFIKAAWLVTKDPRLKRRLEPEGFELVPKKESLMPSQDWEREIGDVHIALSGLHAEVRDALEDGRIDRHEANGLLKTVGRVRVELAELEAMVLRADSEGRVISIAK